MHFWNRNLKGDYCLLWTESAGCENVGIRQAQPTN